AASQTTRAATTAQSDLIRDAPAFGLRCRAAVPSIPHFHSSILLSLAETGVSPNHRLSILLCWLRFRCGALSFAWPFPRPCSSSVTNSTGFLLLFGSGRIALAPFLAFLTQLLLVQVGLVLFIGKTTAQTSGGNCQGRCNFCWPATRYHMPWAFRQRISIRQRKLTTTRSTLMRHSLSYRDRPQSSNAEVATRVDYHFNVQAAELALCRRSGDGRPGVDNLSVFFLAQGEQSADAVMARLTTFVRAAKQTLDLGVYDMRFSNPLRTQLAAALHERADAGVQIRFCYDGDKPPQPNVAAGQDPAPAGTGSFVQSLGYPWRRIAGMKLMHNKFIVRDRQLVWTGSTNMTDDAFTLMENNILEIDSAPLADYYAQDFDQLWEKENFDNTGNIQTAPVPLTITGQPATAPVRFSPG